LTIESILSKTYYNVNSHQPESLDWFNVLIAQTLAQFRADAQRDDALLSSLTTALNGASRPPWLDEIRVVELSLGEEFPIFSNCRVIPVGEDGNAIKLGDRSRGIGWGGRLQARMDVDLSDFITLGLETKLLLNYPKPLTAILPVAVAVSVVRFSGTLSISFNPSSVSPSGSPTSASGGEAAESAGEGKEKLRKSATTLTFSFLDDYRLDFSIRSLVGSRARLQDVPKIAALVEKRLHDWFDERCVEPRVQEVVLPSLWPRKKNTRRGDGEGAAAASGTSSAATGTPLVGSLSRKEANEARKVVQMEARREVEREEEAKREWERQRERERQHEQEGEMRRRRVRGEHSHSTGSGSRREDEFAMPGSMPGGL
jgi:maintenance of morphology protein 1